eukprot:5288755-Pyramimonas_sp.AAC.1
MSTLGICAANTYGARRITSVPYCTTHVQRVLDYILSPTRWYVDEARANQDMSCQVQSVEPIMASHGFRAKVSAHSDHALVWVTVKSKEPTRPALPPRPVSLVGWQPTDDTARNMFRVLADVSIEGLATDAVGTDLQQ